MNKPPRPMEPDGEPHYLARSREGDLAAFEALVRIHQGWLRSWLRGQLFDTSAADDLAQETFITAFRRISSYRGEGTFEAWLRGIAHNHFRNYIRKKRHELVGNDFSLELLLHEASPESVGKETLEALEECLEGLAGKSRRLLESRYVQGETVRQIAEATGKGYSSLTMSLHRLREGLRACVELKLGGAE